MIRWSVIIFSSSWLKICLAFVIIFFFKSVLKWESFYYFQLFIALVLSVASALARPEIGIEKKFENAREISAQQLFPLTDSAQLPWVYMFLQFIRCIYNVHFDLFFKIMFADFVFFYFLIIFIFFGGILNNFETN